ncbi:MAG TPA: phage terminase large subunit [Chryseolinea sp.]|nr:phage terminase large subunit [Chryseolinea sp.]
MLTNASFHFNHKYQQVFTTKARYILLWGGRARGGSHFGTDYFLYKMTQPEYFRGALMRSIYGDIKGSLWQDWKDRLESSSFDDSEFDINERMTATYKKTGNGFLAKGFKKSSSKQSAKLKSLAGMTHILIEETEETEEDDFDKLDDSVRTNKIEDIQIMMLFNQPGKNHWLMKRFFNLIPWDPKEHGDYNPDAEGYYIAVPKDNPDVLIIHTTYLDNIKNLNPKTISKYINYGNPDSPFYNPEKYYTDVLGLVAEGVRGRIYKKFRPISLEFFKALPYESFYGLDFGYSDDPVALVELKNHNNRNFWRERIYESGLTNPALSEKMTAQGISKKSIIYADNAEPKSIQELRDLGWNVKEADKGTDSVNFGIKQLISMDNYYTDESKNIEMELQEYKWHLDANKEPTDTPVDKKNHAMDGGRYGITTHKQLKRRKKFVTSNGEVASDVPARINPLDWA